MTFINPWMTFIDPWMTFIDPWMTFIDKCCLSYYFSSISLDNLPGEVYNYKQLFTKIWCGNIFYIIIVEVKPSKQVNLGDVIDVGK